MRKLILIVGLPGSGKSTVADFIEKKFNADEFHTGDIIREEIRRRGLIYTPENDAKFAHWFHTGGREKLLVERVWKKISKSKKSLIVIEGFRSEKNLEHLKEISKSRPIIISVVSPLNVRVRRELKRGRFGRKESVDYIKFRDRLEKGHGIMRLMKHSGYTINNSKMSIRQSNARTYKIIKEILAN